MLHLRTTSKGVPQTHIFTTPSEGVYSANPRHSTCKAILPMLHLRTPSKGVP